MTTIDDLNAMIARAGRQMQAEAAKASFNLLDLPPLSPEERAAIDEVNRIARAEYAETQRLRALYPSYAWRRPRRDDDD